MIGTLKLCNNTDYDIGFIDSAERCVNLGSKHISSFDKETILRIARESTLIHDKRLTLVDADILPEIGAVLHDTSAEESPFYCSMKDFFSPYYAEGIGVIPDILNYQIQFCGRFLAEDTMMFLSKELAEELSRLTGFCVCNKPQKRLEHIGMYRGAKVFVLPDDYYHRQGTCKIDRNMIAIVPACEYCFEPIDFLDIGVYQHIIRPYGTRPTSFIYRDVSIKKNLESKGVNEMEYSIDKLAKYLYELQLLRDYTSRLMTDGRIPWKLHDDLDEVYHNYLHIITGMLGSETNIRGDLPSAQGNSISTFTEEFKNMFV